METLPERPPRASYSTAPPPGVPAGTPAWELIPEGRVAALGAGGDLSLVVEPAPPLPDPPDPPKEETMPIDLGTGIQAEATTAILDALVEAHEGVARGDAGAPDAWLARATQIASAVHDLLTAELAAMQVLRGTTDTIEVASRPRARQDPAPSRGAALAREYIEREGCSISEAARRSGVPGSSLRGWLRGVSSPRAEARISMEIALGVPAATWDEPA